MSIQWDSEGRVLFLSGVEDEHHKNKLDRMCNAEARSLAFGIGHLVAWNNAQVPMKKHQATPRPDKNDNARARGFSILPAQAKTVRP